MLYISVYIGQSQVRSNVRFIQITYLKIHGIILSLGDLDLVCNNWNPTQKSDAQIEFVSRSYLVPDHFFRNSRIGKIVAAATTVCLDAV